MFFLGEIGERIFLKVLDFELVHSYKTDFGLKHIYKFYTKEGVCVWRTNKFIGQTEDIRTITGTVKRHQSKYGEPQTELSRCKINTLP